MYREKIEALKEWKNKDNKKVLLIKGAKFVGKTYLTKNFALQNYERTVYIRCKSQIGDFEYQILNSAQNEEFEVLETENLVKNLNLSKEDNIIRIAKKIGEVDKEKEKVLVIIDNLEENMELIKQINTVNCKLENIDLIVITSNWGITTNGISLENKNIESIIIRPLNYIEFLFAIGEEELAKNLKNIKIQEIQESEEIKKVQELKAKYINNLKKYMYIGGMPEVVANFSENKNYQIVRQLQVKIVENIKKYIEKKAPSLILGEIKSILKNIPIQLKKKDKRFVCKEIDRSAQDWQYDLAVNFLKDLGLIHKVTRITTPEEPLAVYQNNMHYRLFFIDVGLLSAMENSDLKVILEENQIFNMENSVLTTQFICQEFLSKIFANLYYWQEEKYFYNIDFVIQYQGKIYSFQIDTINKENNKDLWIYHFKFKQYNCYRITISQFEEKGWNIDTPIYLI